MLAHRPSGRLIERGSGAWSNGSPNTLKYRGETSWDKTPRSRAVPVADSSKEAAEHGRTVLPIHSGTVRCVGGETSWDKPPSSLAHRPSGGLFESQDSRVWPNRSPKTLEHRALCRRWDFVRQPRLVLALPLSRCLWCMRSSLACVRLATTHSRVGISFPAGFTY